MRWHTCRRTTTKALRSLALWECFLLECERTNVMLRDTHRLNRQYQWYFYSSYRCDKASHCIIALNLITNHSRECIGRKPISLAIISTLFHWTSTFNHHSHIDMKSLISVNGVNHHMLQRQAILTAFNFLHASFERVAQMCWHAFIMSSTMCICISVDIYHLQMGDLLDLNKLWRKLDQSI